MSDGKEGGGLQISSRWFCGVEEDALIAQSDLYISRTKGPERCEAALILPFRILLSLKDIFCISRYFSQVCLFYSPFRSAPWIAFSG